MKNKFMKYLQEYMTERQNELFKKTGAFFAFGNEQFKKGLEKVGATPENKVTEIGSGMYCLTKNVDELTAGLEKIYKESIQQDLEENGMIGVIKRELANHEAYFTESTQETIEKLEDYPGITPELVNRIFKIKNTTLEELMEI